MAMSGIQSRNGQALGALLQTNPESPGSLINVSALNEQLEDIGVKNRKMKEVTQEYRKKLMNSKFDMMQFNGVKEKNLCINSRVEQTRRSLLSRVDRAYTRGNPASVGVNGEGKQINKQNTIGKGFSKDNKSNYISGLEKTIEELRLQVAQLERENAEYLIIRQSEENQLAAKSNQIARLNDSYQKALRKFSEGSQRDHIECPNCDTLNARLRQLDIEFEQMQSYWRQQVEQLQSLLAGCFKYSDLINLEGSVEHNQLPFNTLPVTSTFLPVRQIGIPQRVNGLTNGMITNPIRYGVSRPIQNGIRDQHEKGQIQQHTNRETVNRRTTFNSAYEGQPIVQPGESILTYQNRLIRQTNDNGHNMMTINPHPVAHVEQNGARSLPIGYIQMENTFNQNTIQRQDVQPRPMISISKGVSINGNGISITNPSRQFHPNFYPQDSPASATQLSRELIEGQLEAEAIQHDLGFIKEQNNNLKSETERARQNITYPVRPLTIPETDMQNDKLHRLIAERQRKIRELQVNQEDLLREIDQLKEQLQREQRSAIHLLTGDMKRCENCEVLSGQLRKAKESAKTAYRKHQTERQQFEFELHASKNAQESLKEQFANRFRSLEEQVNNSFRQVAILTKERQELIQINSRLKNDSSIKKNDNEMTKNETEKLKYDNENLAQRVKEFSVQEQRLNTKILTLEAKIQILEKSIAESEGLSSKKLKQISEKYSNETTFVESSLEKQFESLKAMQKQKQSQNETLKGFIHELQEKYGKASRDLIQLQQIQNSEEKQTMRRKKEQEIIQNGMKARISDLEYTVSKAFEEKRELSKKLQQRLAEIVQKEETIETLRQSHDIADREMKKAGMVTMESSQNENMLRKVIESLQKTVQKNNAERRQFSQIIGDHESTIQTLGSKIKTLQMDLDRQKQLREHTIAHETALKQVIQNLRTEVAQYRQKISKAILDQTTLRSAIQALKVESFEHKDKAQRASFNETTLKSTIQTLNAEVVEYREKVERANFNEVALKAAIKNLRIEVAQNREKIEGFLRNQVTLKSNIQTLRKQAVESQQNLQRAISNEVALKNAIQNLRQEASQHMENSQRAISNEMTFKSIIQNLRIQLAENKQKVQTLTRNQITLKSTIQSLRAQTAEQKQNFEVGLSNEMTLKSRIQSIQVQAEQYKQQLQHAKSNEVTLKSIIQNLRTEVIANRENLQRAIGNEAVLKKTIQSLRTQAAEYKQTISRALSNQVALKKTIQSLSEEVAQRQQTVQLAISNEITLKQIIQNLKAEAHQNKENIQALIRNEVTLKSGIQSVRAQAAQYKEKLQRTISNEVVLKTEIQKLRQETTEHAQNVKRAISNEVALKTAIQSLRAEATKHKENVQRAISNQISLRSTIQNLKTQVVENRQKIEILSKNEMALKSAMQNLRKQAAQTKENFQRASYNETTLRSEVQSLKAEAIDYAEKIQRALSNEMTLKSTVQSLRAEVAEEKKNIQRAMSNERALKITIQNLSGEAAQHKENVQRAISNQMNFKSLIQNLRAEVAENKQKIQILMRNEMASKSTIKNLRKQAAQSNENLQRTVSNEIALKTEVQRLKIEETKLKQNFQRALSNEMNLKSVIQSLRAQTQQRVQKAQSASLNEEKLMLKISNLIAEVSEAKQKFERAILNQIALKSAIQSLKWQVAEQKSLVQRSTSNQVSLKAMIHSLKAEVANQSQLSQLSNSNEVTLQLGMETLKAEIENERQVAEQAKRSEKNLQYTISSLKSDLAAQRQLLHTTQSNQLTLRSTIDGLKGDIFKLNSELSKKDLQIRHFQLLQEHSEKQSVEIKSIQSQLQQNSIQSQHLQSNLARLIQDNQELHFNLNKQITLLNAQKQQNQTQSRLYEQIAGKLMTAKNKQSQLQIQVQQALSICEAKNSEIVSYKSSLGEFAHKEQMYQQNIAKINSMFDSYRNNIIKEAEEQKMFYESRLQTLERQLAQTNNNLAQMHQQIKSVYQENQELTEKVHKSVIDNSRYEEEQRRIKSEKIIMTEEQENIREKSQERTIQELESNIRHQLQSKIRDQLESKIREQLQQQIKDGFQSKTVNQLRSKTREQLELNMRDELNSQIRSSLQPQIRQQLTEQLQVQLHKMKEEMESKIIKEKQALQKSRKRFALQLEKMREAQDKIHLEEEKQIRELAEQVIRREEQIQKREEEEEVRRVTRLQEMTEFNAKEQKRVQQLEKTKIFLIESQKENNDLKKLLAEHAGSFNNLEQAKKRSEQESENLKGLLYKAEREIERLQGIVSALGQSEKTKIQHIIRLEEQNRQLKQSQQTKQTNDQSIKMAPAEQFSQILPKNESLTFLRDETESRLILDYQGKLKALQERMMQLEQLRKIDHDKIHWLEDQNKHLQQIVKDMQTSISQTSSHLQEKERMIVSTRQRQSKTMTEFIGLHRQKSQQATPIHKLHQQIGQSPIKYSKDRKISKALQQLAVLERSSRRQMQELMMSAGQLQKLVNQRQLKQAQIAQLENEKLDLYKKLTVAEDYILLMMNEKEANIFVLSQVTKELNQAREHSHKVQLSVKEQKEKEIKAAEAIRADYERELTVKLAMIDLEKSQLANKIVAYEKQQLLLRQQITKLQNEVSLMKKQLMGKDRQINETEKQIQQIQTKLNSLEVESESARFQREKLEKAEDFIDQVIKEREFRQRQMAHMMTVCEQLNAQLEMQRANMRDSQRRNEILKTFNQQQGLIESINLGEVPNQPSNIASDIASQKHLVPGSTQQKNTAQVPQDDKQKLEQANQALLQKEDQCSELKAKISKLQAKIQSLEYSQSIIKLLESQRRTKKEIPLKELASDQTQQKEQLEKVLQEEKKMHEEDTARNIKLQTQIKQQEQILYELDQTNRKLATELQRSLSSFQAEKRQMQAQLISSVSENQALQANMAALATENFELGRRIQLLDQQVAEITQSITISYPAPEVPQTEDLLFFKNKLLEAENYIFRIEKEKEAGRQAYFDLLNQSKALMTEFALLKDVREEKTGLLDKIALLEKEIESLKTLQRNTTTENDLEVADNNLANQLHAAEIGLMTSSIDGLKQELSNKNSDIAVLQQKLENIEKQLVSLNTPNQSGIAIVPQEESPAVKQGIKYYSSKLREAQQFIAVLLAEKEQQELLIANIERQHTKLVEDYNVVLKKYQAVESERRKSTVQELENMSAILRKQPSQTDMKLKESSTIIEKGHDKTIQKMTNEIKKLEDKLKKEVAAREQVEKDILKIADELQQTLIQKEAARKQFESQKKEFNLRTEEIMKEISELQLQIQQQERTNQTLDQQTAVTQSLNEQIALNDERVKQIDSLRNILDQEVTQKGEILTELAQLQKERHQFIIRQDEMAKIVANLKSHLIDETAKREQIGNELLTIQGNLEAATTQRVSTEQSFITLKQNLNEVIAQRDEAGCIIAHLQGQLHQVGVQKDSLVTKFAHLEHNLKKALTQKQQIKQQFVQLQAKFIEANAERQNRDKQFACLQNQLKEVVTQKDSICVQFSKVQDHLNDVLAKKQNLCQQFVIVQNRLAEEMAKTQDIGNLQRKLNESQSQKEQLAKQIATLQINLANAVARNKQMVDIQIKRQRASSQQEQVAKQVNTLREQLSDVYSSKEAMSKEVATLQILLNDAALHKQEFTQEMIELKSDLNQARYDNQLMVKEILRLETELQKANIFKNDIVSEIGNLENELNTAVSHKEELNKEISQLKNEINSSVHYKEESIQLRRDWDSVVAQRENMSDELQRLREGLEMASIQKEKLMKEVDKLTLQLNQTLTLKEQLQVPEAKRVILIQNIGEEFSLTNQKLSDLEGKIIAEAEKHRIASQQLFLTEKEKQELINELRTNNEQKAVLLQKLRESEQRVADIIKQKEVVLSKKQTQLSSLTTQLQAVKSVNNQRQTIIARFAAQVSALAADTEVLKNNLANEKRQKQDLQKYVNNLQEIAKQQQINLFNRAALAERQSTQFRESLLESQLKQKQLQEIVAKVEKEREQSQPSISEQRKVESHPQDSATMTGILSQDEEAMRNNQINELKNVITQSQKIITSLSDKLRKTQRKSVEQREQLLEQWQVQKLMGQLKNKALFHEMQSVIQARQEQKTKSNITQREEKSQLQEFQNRLRNTQIQIASLEQQLMNAERSHNQQKQDLLDQWATEQLISELRNKTIFEQLSDYAKEMEVQREVQKKIEQIELTKRIAVFEAQFNELKEQLITSENRQQMLREELEVTSLSQAAEKSELLAKIDLYERELRFAQLSLTNPPENENTKKLLVQAETRIISLQSDIKMQKSEHQLQLQELNKRNAALEDEHRKMEQILEVIQTQTLQSKVISDKKDDKIGLVEQVPNDQQRIEFFRSKLYEAEEFIVASQKEKEFTEIALAELQDQFKNLTTEFALLRVKLIESESQRKVVEDELAKRRLQGSQYISSGEQGISESRETLSRLRQRVDIDSSKIDSIEEQLVGNSQQIEQLNQKLGEKEQIIIDMQHTIQNLQATKGSESDKAFENSKVVDSASHGNETFETKTSFEKPKDSPQTSGQQTINGEVFQPIKTVPEKVEEGQTEAVLKVKLKEKYEQIDELKYQFGMAQKIVSEFEKQELKRQESSKASEKSYADWQYEVECLKNKRESLIQQVLAGKQRQEEYQEMIENAAKTESRLLQGQTVINKQKQIEQLNKQVEELAHQLRLSHKEQADLSQQIFIKSQELEAAVLGKTQESESNQELYKQELEAQLQIIHELNQAKVELQNQVKELQSALQRKYVSPSKRLSSEGSAESQSEAQLRLIKAEGHILELENHNEKLTKEITLLKQKLEAKLVSVVSAEQSVEGMMEASIEPSFGPINSGSIQPSIRQGEIKTAESLSQLVAKKPYKEGQTQLQSSLTHINQIISNLINSSSSSSGATGSNYSETMAQLAAYPELEEALSALRQRLQLATAIEAQNRTIKVEMQHMLDLHRKQQEQSHELSQSVYAKLLEYQRLNKELKNEVSSLQGEKNYLTELIAEGEKLIEQGDKISSELLDSSVPVTENNEKRQKLQTSEANKIQSLQDNNQASMFQSEASQYKNFLMECLQQITKVQGSIDEIEKDLLTAKQYRFRMHGPSEHVSENDREIIEQRLQQLEKHLMINANRMRQHQESSQNRLMELLRDELQAFDEQTNVDKFKIEQYLTLLEEQIVRSNQLHEEELENLRRDYLSLLHKQDLSKHRSSSAFSSQKINVYNVGKFHDIPESHNLRVQDTRDKIKTQHLYGSSERSPMDLPEQSRFSKRNSQHYQEDIAAAATPNQMKQRQLALISTPEESLKADQQRQEMTMSFGRQQQRDASTRQQLVKEIQGLTQAIDIYHDEAQKQRKQYEGYEGQLNYLKNQLKEIKQQCDAVIVVRGNAEKSAQQAARLKLKIDAAMESASNFVSSQSTKSLKPSLEVKQQQKDSPQRINMSSISGQQSIHMLQQRPPTLQTATQADLDVKPFLAYLLDSKDIDREDILFLKKRIAEMKNKEVEESKSLLRANEDRLKQILEVGGETVSGSQNIENIMTTLANNLSLHDLSLLFESNDNSLALDRINEAICMQAQDSYYKTRTAIQLQTQIQTRRFIHYPQVTNLSDVIIRNLLKILQSRTDYDFYYAIEELFRECAEVQAAYELIIRKKDQVYKQHTENMNKILNPSSSSNPSEIDEFIEGISHAIQLQQEQSKVQLEAHMPNIEYTSQEGTGSRLEAEYEGRAVQEEEND